MDWIAHFQLFLFDFDGLLVNTADLHFEAYRRTCADRGYTLPWTFSRYCQAAHISAEGLRDQIYAEFPELQQQEPDWAVVYSEKRRNYAQLVQEGSVEMMPGATELLQALAAADAKRCVVTHSPEEHISLIRQQHGILDSIPRWFMREHYSKPKPDPECYLKAIKDMADEGDRIIGFEDTARGLTALMGTSATAVLVCDSAVPFVPEALRKGALHVPNLQALSSATLFLDSQPS